MHAANSYYGHKQILADFCGFETRPPPVWGFIQHGWHPGGGFGATNAPFFKQAHKFVWTVQNKRVLAASGLGTSHAIGAPFLYMPAPVFDEVSRPTTPNSVLFYPFHSSPWEEAVGDWKALVGFLSTSYDPDLLTTCLYWRDYRNDAVRQEFASRGLRIITHGSWHDPTFLYRQAAGILAHSTVAANRMGTALLYAGFLRRSIGVYGPVFGVEHQSEGIANKKQMQSRWPSLFDDGLDSAQAWELASNELGRDAVRGADELIGLFGWTPVKRVVGQAIEPMIAGARSIWHLHQRALSPSDRVR